MAVSTAGIKVDLHEVSLKNKPQSMLDVSSKGTVPVLCVEGKIIDESLDVMLWAIQLSACLLSLHGCAFHHEKFRELCDTTPNQGMNRIPKSVAFVAKRQQQSTPYFSTFYAGR